MKNLTTRLFGTEENAEAQADGGAAVVGQMNPTTRIVTLEAALAEERKKVAAKEEELMIAQKLCARLEETLDQATRTSQLDAERLSSLEAAMQKRETQDGAEKERAKLLMALSEAKRHKEQAEKTAAEEAARASLLATEVQELKERLEQYESIAPIDSSAGKQSTELAQVQGEEMQELRRQLEIEQLKRESAEEQERIHKSRVEQLLNLLPKKAETSESAEPQDVIKVSADVEPLQQRLREVEDQLASRMGELVHLRERLQKDDAEREEKNSKIMVYDQKVREEKRLLGEAMDQVAAKEARIVSLHSQLAEELSQRQQAQKQLAEKEKELRDCREQPFDRLSKQQAAQEQVIEKEREVCDLQQQLADELAKRQAVQYQVIEKDRVIGELRNELQAISHFEHAGALQDGDPLNETNLLHPIDERSQQENQHMGEVPQGDSLSASWMGPQPVASNRRLPSWMANQTPNNQTRNLSGRVSVREVVPQGLTTSAEKPPWMMQAQSVHAPGVIHMSGGTGAYQPPRHPGVVPSANSYRQRAYHTGSPRSVYGGMSAQVTRRLSNSAQTFSN
mmetsp:Transcript_61888/g.109980  ORF Transcript_61888/g.109980 Transcript_61888/m.109980 type:complete len:566 (+) Transcript_61888:136-1833(+)|eukprot:CAMPEP_0197637512 /NCGR_PEP_ID=MMETSP1338-20131121/12716_1 /TAXON_ID=43686 ORGANISM="Pelagodinium beii, Strain RCC1491" /NCGR_SAMPLE_ID=MMETSP1338 /ASSEMBLY_ACC=CAM_ASM_000754 /LENGTH=565 /DNA_ID=CAMNT_0043209943 /DNA_START=62 /DNA_END=1759 /DNA_ORIENTATION=+